MTLVVAHLLKGLTLACLLCSKVRAQSNVEYGILIATIAIFVLVGVARFGDLIRPWFVALAMRITTNA